MGSGHRPNKTKRGEREYSDEANESVESLDVVSRHRIQILKEATAMGPQSQFTKGWAATEEMFNSLQLLLIATYPAIVRLCSRSSLAT